MLEQVCPTQMVPNLMQPTAVPANCITAAGYQLSSFSGPAVCSVTCGSRIPPTLTHPHSVGSSSIFKLLKWMLIYTYNIHTQASSCRNSQIYIRHYN